jgi:glycerol uptake facilitator-like aquaporin
VSSRDLARRVAWDPPRRFVAEALGTAFLLATVVGSGITAERLADDNLALALLCNTIPTGAILAVLILTLGPSQALTSTRR